jgi:hypothetical protein
MAIYEDDFTTFVNYWVKNVPLPERSDDSLRMGSVIDTLLTRPEEFNDKFIVYKGVYPSGQMLQFCNYLATKWDGITPISEWHQSAYEDVGFKRDNLAKVLEKFEVYRDYFEFLIDSKNKSVVSAEMASRARYIVGQLKDGEYTRGIVNAHTFKSERVDITVFHQLELTQVWTGEPTFSKPKWKKGIAIKGALDKVIVDHVRKVIIPIDYKSSFNVEGFQDSYFKWRYYRQGSFYTFLIKQWAIEQGYDGYTIRPFKFVVCSTTGGKHYIYEMDEIDIKKARTGGTTYNGINVKGWEDILDEIAYMTEVDKWDYPYMAQIKNGIVPLNIFKNE